MAEIQAIKFKQWLPEWDEFVYDADQHRDRPEPYIYLFSMPAVQLRALSGVYRRRRNQGRADGLQRLHDPARSELIRDYVHNGYPYSSLPSQARTKEALALRKPGWLPTAIVVNILTAEDDRRGTRVKPSELVRVTSDNPKSATLHLPYEDALSPWSPTALEPLEVIDGQHRLWAFDEAVLSGELPTDFELPVVAFHGLDLGWQAYLFWSINISPKRINPSHAFDLYPLLRSQDWLETFSDIRIYREARAQELTELLFDHPQSPWYQRINMLGESARTAPEGAGVTQAGWVRALTSTFLGPGGRGRAAKGLFGADVGPDGPLNWSRPQQAALLIYLWREIKKNVLESDLPWVRALTKIDVLGEEMDVFGREAAFAGSRTMLNQEQGVRGTCSISNDILFNLALRDRSRFSWDFNVPVGGDTSIADISNALRSIVHQAFAPDLIGLAHGLSTFDWRSADAPNLSDDERLIRRAFRGSGGYVALRDQLLKHLGGFPGPVGSVASELLQNKAQ